MLKKKEILPALIILFTAIIAFWQIFFLKNELKWDAIDSFLPARYFVSEALRSGFIPLWNPYLSLGTPSYGDMVSVWNPEVWFVSLFTTYNNITLHFVFICYIFLAGLGMFKLLIFFKVNRYFALAGGVAYMLSGFMVGNAQNLSAIAGAAWLPFLALYYWQFLKDTRWKTLFSVLFFLYLMIFNGYPGLTIISVYLLFSFFSVELITLICRKKPWIRFLKFHLFLGVIIIFISSVLIISFIQVSPFIGQYNGGTLEWAQMHPFSPNSLITFLFPLAGTKRPDFFSTDISMTNIFIGTLTLIFFLGSLFMKKNRFLWIVTIFGIFSLLASFGAYFPIRKWLFNYFPMMDVFRYPAFFRLFMIFTVVFSGFYHLETLLTKKKIILKIITIIFLGFLFYFAATRFPETHLNKFNLFDSSKSFSRQLANFSFNDSIFIQAIIQIIIVSIALVFILFKWKIQRKILVFLVIAEMLIATQINAPFTVYSNKNPFELAQKFSHLPMGYPLPTERKIIYNTEKSGTFLPVWRNTNLFHKQISYEGFGSFFLDSFINFTDSFPTFSKKVFYHPAAYLSSYLLPMEKMSDSCKNKDMLFVRKPIFQKYAPMLDTGLVVSDNSIVWEKFSPCHLQLKVHTPAPQILVLMQNYFPYWQATVDGNITETFQTNGTLLSIFIPKGTHLIDFSFSPPLIKLGFYSGMIILLFALLFFLLKYQAPVLAKNSKQIIVVLIVMMWFIARGKINDYNRFYGNYKLINTAISHLEKKVSDKTRCGIIDVNNPKKINKPTTPKTKIHFISLVNKQNWNRLSLLLDTTHSDYFFYSTSYSPFHNEIVEKIREKFPKIIYQVKSENFNFYSFSKQVQKDPEIVVNVWNFMEGNPAGWNNNPLHITTKKAFSWQKSCVVFSESPYSVTYHHLNTGQLDSGSTYAVTMLAQVFLPNDAEGSLVCSISGKDSLFFRQSEKIDSFFLLRNQWSFVGKTFFLKDKFPDGLPIKLYFFNPKKEVPFYIDNMHLIVRRIVDLQ